MERPTSETGSKLGLQMPPGFRFHPTDEELVVHYLAKRSDISFGVKLMAEIDLYKHNPWELPDLAYVGEKEWYFLTPRDRKYPNGARPNRAAASGYWKATGTDKPIYEQKSGSLVGIKKALVFYQGRATQGVKTNWIMHEYRLPESDKAPRNNPSSNSKPGSLRMDDFVLCRIYKKAPSALKATNALPKITIMVKDSIPFEDIFDYVPDQLVMETGSDNRINNCPSAYINFSEQLESSFSEQDFSSSQFIAGAAMQPQNGYDRLKRGIDTILQHKNAINKCSTPTKRFRII